MAAPDKVKALIDNFARHAEDYRKGRKGETEVRVEYIDPFFEALGWDVHNRSGYAEAYKDVVHEDAIKVGGATKAPDYCFRVGGTRKFFLEAKKPSVDIADDIGPAYQLRRYAWSAKLPLSILTDFEELAVYDCRIRPRKGDKASKARVQYIIYTDYLDHWDELAHTFSKEAVLQGSFDKFVHDKKKAKGTAEVDEEFLKEIERWRDHLARNIALRNPHLGVRDVNFAVQRTIDRIIFLRMCEDRGVEAYGRLQGLSNGQRVYPRLLELFRAADDRYNSGLFHFNDERERATSPDTLTPDLDIDDKVLKDIFQNLYYPDSPYEFGVLPADILGNVYEQFLGKVIRLTPAGQAKVEEKPEVKKAGGVYYTPKYIVDYIVKHTVGEIIDGKTPIEIGGLTDSYKPSTARNRRPLTICDPACGSGSFLIGAYRYLLNYHRDWYVNDGPENHTDRIYQGAGGQWLLSTEEKKRILTSCIYGVDIDPQAVEVTKLNLLLAVLENENQQTLGQLNLIHQRVLPDLGSNIKCGNSLIASDFYSNQQLDLFDEDAQYKINAFDWPDEFPHILGQDLPEKQRGFNAVIGNPPYIRIQALKDTQPEAVDYFGKNYKSAEKGNYDIYVVFIEKGHALLNQEGLLGYICPHKFFNSRYGEAARDMIATGRHLRRVVHFGDQQVFSGVTTYCCLLFLGSSASTSFDVHKVNDLEGWVSAGESTDGCLETKELTGTEWSFVVGPFADIYKKLDSLQTRLGDFAERMYQGCITSADKVFLFEEYEENSKGTTRVRSVEENAWIELESSILRPVIRSGKIGRYHAMVSALVLFPYSVVDASGVLLERDQLESRFPLAWAYLQRHKRLLEERERGKFRDRQWYRFGRPQNLGMWERPKLMVPYMTPNLAAYADIGDDYYFINVTTGGYGISVPGGTEALLFLCGLMNSRLLNGFFKCIASTFHGGYFAANKQYIERLPMPSGFGPDLIKCAGLVDLVDRMLSLHKRLGEAQTEHGRVMLERQITATDREIDALVYELYGLSDDEISIVEAATE